MSATGSASGSTVLRPRLNGIRACSFRARQHQSASRPRPTPISARRGRWLARCPPTSSGATTSARTRPASTADAVAEQCWDVHSAHGLQNFRTLSRGSAPGQIRISATLISGNTTYVSAFYSSEAADPSGHGERANFLGSVTSGIGSFSYTFTPIVPVRPGTSSRRLQPRSATRPSRRPWPQHPSRPTYVVNSAPIQERRLQPGQLTAGGHGRRHTSAGTDTIASHRDRSRSRSRPSSLPAVIDPVIINAATQPGYAGVQLERVDGTGDGASTLAWRSSRRDAVGVKLPDRGRGASDTNIVEQNASACPGRLKAPGTAAPASSCWTPASASAAV